MTTLTMKRILTLLIVPTFIANSWKLALAADKEKTIQGVVTLSKEVEKKVSTQGVLFIIAKKTDQKAGPPFAVLKIENPHFPQSFELTSKNLVMGGEFKGKVALSARYSPSGDAMDKSGPQGTDPKSPQVEIGTSNIKIELK